MLDIRPPQLICRVQAEFDVIEQQSGKRKGIIQRQKLHLRKLLVKTTEIKYVVQKGQAERNEQ